MDYICKNSETLLRILSIYTSKIYDKNSTKNEKEQRVYGYKMLKIYMKQYNVR